MAFFYSIKHKILGLPLFAILLSWLLALVMEDYYYTKLYQDRASEILNDPISHTQEYFRNIEARIRRSSDSLAERSDIKATANLFFEYAELAQSDPLIFQPEQKKLALEFSQGANASNLHLIGFYDTSGTLMAYSFKQGQAQEQGILTQGSPHKPSYLVLKGDKGEWTPAPLPKILTQEKPLLMDQHRKVHFRRQGDKIIAEHSSPIFQKRELSGMTWLGSIKSTHILTASDITDYLQDKRLLFSFLQENEPPPFSHDETWGAHQGSHNFFSHTPFPIHEEKDHFGVILRLPLIEGENLFMAFATDKTQQLAQTEQIHWINIGVLFLVIVLIIPISLYVLNRWIVFPLEIIIDKFGHNQIGSIQNLNGNFSHNELGRLAENYNKMVDRILSREAERDQANSRLQEQKQLFYSILASLNDAVIAISSKGEVLMQNDMAMEIIPPELAHLLIDAEPKDLGMYLNEQMELVAKKDCPVNKALKGEWCSGQALYYHPAGAKQGIWLNLKTSPLPLGVGESGAVLTFSDVTSEKHYQLSLEQAKQSAEKANAAKSNFLAIMSHELRTPLNGVLGMAQILMNEDLTPKQLEDCQIILDSGNSLLATLSDILEATRLDANKIHSNLAPFQPNQLLEKITHLFKGAALSKGINLSAKLNALTNREYLGDAYLIERILTNLMANAIKFTEQGEITLALETRPASLAGHHTLIFSVTDTGIGIPEEEKEHIFEAFSQGDESSTRQYGGTGLGLHICQEFVDILGGTLELESSLGEGSTFRVVLELALHGNAQEQDSSKAIATQGDEKAQEDFQDKSVLIVEDDPVNQMVIKSLLERLKIRTKIAPNGKKALELLEREKFDLILMDCRMPIMDGFVTTEEIRKKEAEQNLSRSLIIALTAKTMPTDKEECLAVGMDDYLSKPLFHADLIAKLHQWFSNN